MGMVAFSVAIGFSVIDARRHQEEIEAFSHMTKVEWNFFRMCKEANKSSKPALITEANIHYEQQNCLKETRNLYKIPKEQLKILLPNSLIR